MCCCPLVPISCYVSGFHRFDVCLMFSEHIFCVSICVDFFFVAFSVCKLWWIVTLITHRWLNLLWDCLHSSSFEIVRNLSLYNCNYGILWKYQKKKPFVTINWTPFIRIIYNLPCVNKNLSSFICIAGRYYTTDDIKEAHSTYLIEIKT